MSCSTDAHRERSVTKIFLARHGQSEYNAQRRISGQCDPPLSPKGRRQAIALEQVLRQETLSAIYTSTLTRASETARPTALCHSLPIQRYEALKEMHLGVLQGRFRDDRDLKAQHLWEERKKDLWPCRVPGGETFAELANRVLPCLNEILAHTAGKVVLIVGHRNTNRLILGALLQWSWEMMLDAKPRSRYLYEILPGEAPQITTICIDPPEKAHRYAGFKM